MTVDARAHLRALARAVRDELGLRGPWHWTGDTKHVGPILATRRHGQMYVMRFARHGMSSAQPMFPERVDGKWNRMIKATERPIYEVAPDATDRNDPRLYRHDITGIRNPVADYLAALDADTILDLLDENERMRTLIADLVTDHGDLCDPTATPCACSMARAKTLIGEVAA